MKQDMDVSGIHNIPGYVEILRFVLKTQIQNLVEQLRDHGGEETLVLSANLTAGTISHLGSDKGQGFLDVRDDIRSHFLTHCLQGNQKYHTAYQPTTSPIPLKNIPGMGRKDSSPLCSLQSVNKSISSPSKQFDVCVGHSPGVKSVSLPTIDQVTVRDMIRLPLGTQILPHVSEFNQDSVQHDMSYSISPSTKINSSHSALPTATCASSPPTKLSTEPIVSENLADSKHLTVADTSLLGVKLVTDSNMLHGNRDSYTRGISEVPLQMNTAGDIRDSASMVTQCKEQVSKPTKRKQKRRGETQSNLPVHAEIKGKKTKVYESLLSPDTVVTIVPTTSTCVVSTSNQVKGSVSVLGDSGKNSVPSDSSVGNISLLNMQPVLLLNESNMADIAPQNVFIGSAIHGHPIKKSVPESTKSSTMELSGMTSLIGQNKCAVDPKEKDKTKKTLSSKIDEITQRITKDDAIKQHTVHTKISEFSPDLTAPPVYSNSSAPQNGLSDCPSLSSVSAGNHSMDGGSMTHININCSDNNGISNMEHLPDSEGKCKDGSRASHRKPKLPRFNIGVASDDEDNGDNSQCSSPQTPALLNTMVTTPSSVNISHDDAQDIINIQVSNEDSETSFPHINLEELADGLLLTDIPIVNYYNNVDESSKSLIESVFNLKPGRDPSTKKPLNSQSVIVCGSKQEKDWVKCPLCPDKFLTVEALQFHIKNVNHAVKKYKCDLCGRKFGQLRDMERHRRIHTGERPFTCDVCHKSFSRKDNLKSHRKKHPMNV